LYRYIAALNGFIQQANTRRVWWALRERANKMPPSVVLSRKNALFGSDPGRNEHFGQAVNLHGGVEMLRGHVQALDQLRVPGGSMLGFKVDPTGSGHLKAIPFLPVDHSYNGATLVQELIRFLDLRVDVDKLQHDWRASDLLRHLGGAVRVESSLPIACNHPISTLELPMK
jgi:hypothetical protein